MRTSDELRLALDESVGELLALGWKVVSPGVYEKDGKLLHRRGRTNWYIGDEKIGRLSDRKLIELLRSRTTA